jgi:hypothetical protein
MQVGTPGENGVTARVASQGLLPVVFGPKEAGSGAPFGISIPAGAFAIGSCVFSGPGTRFTCFTSTKVRILTQKLVPSPSAPVSFQGQVLSLLALLVQKYAY